MINFERIVFAQEKVLLTSEKALFLPKHKSLILSDLHLGKTTFFQNNGIGVPTGSAQKDLARIGLLIEEFEPISVIVAGDFFHASANDELELFKVWRDKYADIDFILTKGNHDRLRNDIYQSIGIKLVKNFPIGHILVNHEPLDDKMITHICGHIHPGAKLKLSNRQWAKLACYVVSDKQIILPAFSQFTGLDTRKFDKESQIYGIADGEIIVFNENTKFRNR